MQRNPYMYKYLITIICLVLSQTTFSQSPENQEENFWSKVRFGGNVGLGFTNNVFNAVLAPTAVYQFNDKVSAGVGLNFGYSTFNNEQAGQKSRLLNYGGSIIGLYSPFQGIQLSLEFEEIGVTQFTEILDQDITTSYIYPALFVGAGYQTGNVSFGMRYDLLYDEQKSIYGSAYIPFVRVFF